MNSYRRHRILGSGRSISVDFVGAPPEIGTREAVARLAPEVNSIQLSMGQAEWLQELPGRDKAGLIVALDITNVRRVGPSAPLYSRSITRPVDQAVRLDAAAVLATLYDVDGQPRFTQQCAGNIQAIRAATSRLEIPLLVELSVLEAAGDCYQPVHDPARLQRLVEKATWLGADLLQIDSGPEPIERISTELPVLARWRPGMELRGIAGLVCGPEVTLGQVRQLRS